MMTAATTRIDSLCRDKCLEAHVSVLCLAEMRAGQAAGPCRVGTSSVALSDVFGRIAAALGAVGEPTVRVISRHKPGTA